MASGLCAALTGRTHGCTDQPASVKKTLANSEPSTHGTSLPSAHVRFHGEYWRVSGPSAKCSGHFVRGVPRQPRPQSVWRRAPSAGRR